MGRPGVNETTGKRKGREMKTNTTSELARIERTSKLAALAIEVAAWLSYGLAGAVVVGGLGLGPVGLALGLGLGLAAGLWIIKD